MEVEEEKDKLEGEEEKGGKEGKEVVFLPKSGILLLRSWTCCRSLYPQHLKSRHKAQLEKLLDAGLPHLRGPWGSCLLHRWDWILWPSQMRNWHTDSR